MNCSRSALGLLACATIACACAAQGMQARIPISTVSSHDLIRTGWDIQSEVSRASFEEPHTQPRATSLPLAVEFETSRFDQPGFISAPGSACTSGGCDFPLTDFPSICCSNCPRWWVRAEVLLWWLQDDLPPLITSSPASAPADLAGVLGNPATQALYDGDNGMRVGGRITTGWWFDNCRHLGFQIDLLGIGASSGDYALASEGDPIIARPFFNTATGQQDAQILAADGLASGSIDVNAGGQLYSIAPALRWNIRCCTGSCGTKTKRFDFLAGYRYFNLEQDLSLVETLMPAGQFFAPGTTYTFVDSVETSNDFHGGEFGLDYWHQHGRWVWELSSRVALGNLRQRVRAAGSTRAVVPGGLDNTVDGGFLVPAGGVDFTNDEFSVIPQARLGLGYFLNSCLRAHVAYDFLYVTNVVRPSAAIDDSIDPSRLLSGTGGPVTVNDTNVWLQGVSIGFTLNF